MPSKQCVLHTFLRDRVDCSRCGQFKAVFYGKTAMMNQLAWGSRALGLKGSRKETDSHNYNLHFSSVSHFCSICVLQKTYTM